MHRRFELRRALRALPSLRQHFLKRDTVFFEPSHILEGNMAKKAKKAKKVKKAKSAVKKTAKKTRKVAKKK
ncbi:hypothetical protein chiPu_0029295 [Chiloscyllium punctatum]|uniref:Uncharacterized protein n=1 Tax=Chiloscyllium punctatum TaxID=137246 RepID=A0A401TRN0_CHIPU|nr:hypothetical protein [Chiloscyllium punctatum]